MEMKMAVLPGDGIGPEVMDAAIRVLKNVLGRYGHEAVFEKGLIGGAAIDETGTPLPEETLEICRRSDAILLGAVGGPKWDHNPASLRPEKGLLGLRKEMGLFANLRPVKAYAPLLSASPLKREFVENVDLVIVRELTGGLYFGRPSERRGPAQHEVVDTLQYTREEIERIVDKAFQLARIRRKKLASVDKANVLESSRMWREIVEETSAKYPDVEVRNMLVDSTSMQLIANPGQFDVIVTENMFGDILSDEASMITGSLGMLPSASLRSDRFGMYEPVHGSAPDIAGQGKANPLGTVLSAAMMLRYSFGLEKEAEAIEKAVDGVLRAGYCTGDLQVPNGKIVGTDELAGRLIEKLGESEAASSVSN
ncbi:3-isopropylmalate dehydrogenase [Weizmannia acidilactici]|uniref:3-isopropylmalate dehydrogenase n=1 Tax=Weizmannia acidilactici TaxID=2607726 RepID=A0A5J4JE60_9BACI|nr:3-isopropylmalate dehydrogenase [Weizmannia acidilactici]GER67149.1 3-isopropylmalate dehydrogenase [Weizmannia acidilactici]GER69659.1 3-isopropylmalate dehydrogenase [Weizmannia acidilactici]GER72521.1 3-isopropylmalate dehydrogenase [Weizmannia acidilactici]